LTQGTDPIFRTVDGSNCDRNIGTSTPPGRASGSGRRRLRGNERQHSQAADAVAGHERGSAPPSLAQQQQIVAFETSLFAAQVIDFAAGPLNAMGAVRRAWTDRHAALLSESTILIGGNPKGTPFTSTIFSLWDSARPREQASRGVMLF